MNETTEPEDHQESDHEDELESEYWSEWKERELIEGIREYLDAEGVPYSTPETPPEHFELVMKRISDIPLPDPNDPEILAAGKEAKTLEDAEKILEKASGDEVDEDIKQFWQDRKTQREDKIHPPEGRNDLGRGK